jgi:hypothetical protein
MNSNGLFNSAVVSVTSCSAARPIPWVPCVLPSIATSSASGSVSRCVGYIFGEGFEPLGAGTAPVLSTCLLSSGEPAIVCASRKPLGVRGACCCAADGERMDSVWEVADGGDVGRGADMMDGGRIPGTLSTATMHTYKQSRKWSFCRRRGFGVSANWSIAVQDSGNYSSTSLRTNLTLMPTTDQFGKETRGFHVKADKKYACI